MKMTDEQFYKLIGKIKEKPLKNKVISDTEFEALLSKAKTFKIQEEEISFEKKIEKVMGKIMPPKKEKIKKIPTAPLYNKILDLYDKLIEREPTTKTIIKKIRIAEENNSTEEINKLYELLAEMQKKIRVYENYNFGGPGIVMHDSTLSGSGVPGDPLKVVAGAGSNVVFGEVVAGSNTTFTLAHVPVGTISLAANGQVLTLTVDYTISGKVITTLSRIYSHK